MTNPTISIVLPTHNGYRFIDQSIASVIKQTWQDWELIIVDDASTDATPARIDWWAARDERITAIHLPKNRTLPGALNDGFARAKGEFHTWTSDDNWYQPGALARMLDILQADRNVDIVYTDHVNVYECGTRIERSEAGSADDLYVMNRIGPCFLYRREVTHALKGYDEELFGAEDYDFWLRASLHFRLRHLSEVLYYYRHHSGSISARKWHLIARNVERAVRRWLPQVRWVNDNIRRQAYIEWGVRCLRASTWEEIYEPWLQEADWLDDETRWWMRREVLKRATQLAWEAHCRRDWTDFEKYKAYLSEVCNEPQVVRFLTKRFYPRWVYSIKDRLCNSWNRLRSMNPRPRYIIQQIGRRRESK